MSKYIPKVPDMVVRQYSLDGKFIAEYKNAPRAARENKLSPNAVYDCISGRLKTAGGFFWRKEFGARLPEDQLILEKSHKHIISAICQLDLDGNFIKEYKSPVEASRVTGINNHNIINVVNGKLKSAGGYIWRRKKELEDITPNELSKKYDRKDLVPVLQLDMDGNLIKRYPAINVARKETKIPYSTIVKAISGIIESAGGFKWKAEKEYTKPKYLETSKESSKPEKRKNKNNREGIVAFNLEGEKVKEFLSISAASLELNVDYTSIWYALENNEKTCKKYFWRRKSEVKDKTHIDFGDRHAIYQLDLEGNIIREFPSTRIAAKAVNTVPDNIRNALCGRNKTAAGFKWKYKEERKVNYRPLN